MIVISILDITNRCNLNCVYCCRGQKAQNKEEPTYTQLIKAIEQIIQSRGTFVVLQGGEPLIREDIVSLIEEMGCMKDTKIDFFYQGLRNLIHACLPQDKFTYRYKMLLIEQGLPLYCVTTNGMFYSERLRSAFRKAGFSIEVSLDSSEQEINSRTRLGINFLQVKTNIQNYAQELPVEISCTVTEDNVDAIADMLPFARENGCICVKFNPVIMIGKRTKGDDEWRERYLKALHLVLDEHEKAPNTLYLKIKLMPYMFAENKSIYQRIRSSKNILLEEHECSAFKKMKDIYIDTEMNVYACASMKNNVELIIGNLKSDSLYSIWHSQRRRELESMIKPFCLQNSQFGGCTAAAYSNERKGD